MKIEATVGTMRVVVGHHRVYGPQKRTPRVGGVLLASRPNKDVVKGRYSLNMMQFSEYCDDGIGSFVGRESFDLLNSFFYGKALAEVLNERMGNMAADILAELGTVEAELRKTMDDIQEEVIARAQREMSQSTNTGGQLPGSEASLPVAIDEDEAVDNLRAEIASTRSLIQQVRNK